MKIKILLTICLFTLLFFSCEKDNNDTDDTTEPKNNSPVLADIGWLNVHLGETEYIEISATDLDGDLLTFSITKNPGFLSITDFSQTGNKATATLVMNPDMSVRGGQDATIQVSDGKGGTDSENVNISISYTLVTLYLNNWSELSESTYGSYQCWSTHGGNITQVFNGYYLTNDLVGTEYSFHLRCECNSTREFSAYIKIGGKKVAEAKFDVSGDLKRYDIYVEGEDPDITDEAEVELYVTINGTGEGVESSLCWSWGDDHKSYICLPPMDKK
jgi:hypothetical protein